MVPLLKDLVDVGVPDPFVFFFFSPNLITFEPPPRGVSTLSLNPPSGRRTNESFWTRSPGCFNPESREFFYRTGRRQPERLPRTLQIKTLDFLRLLTFVGKEEPFPVTIPRSPSYPLSFLVQARKQWKCKIRRRSHKGRPPLLTLRRTVLFTSHVLDSGCSIPGHLFSLEPELCVVELSTMIITVLMSEGL